MKPPNPIYDAHRIAQALSDDAEDLRRLIQKLRAAPTDTDRITARQVAERIQNQTQRILQALGGPD